MAQNKVVQAQRWSSSGDHAAYIIKGFIADPPRFQPTKEGFSNFWGSHVEWHSLYSEKNTKKNYLNCWKRLLKFLETGKGFGSALRKVCGLESTERLSELRKQFNIRINYRPAEGADANKSPADSVDRSSSSDDDESYLPTRPPHRDGSAVSSDSLDLDSGFVDDDLSQATPPFIMPRRGVQGSHGPPVRDVKPPAPAPTTTTKREATNNEKGIVDAMGSLGLRTVDRAMSPALDMVKMGSFTERAFDPLTAASGHGRYREGIHVFVVLDPKVDPESVTLSTEDEGWTLKLTYKVPRMYFTAECIYGVYGYNAGFSTSLAAAKNYFQDLARKVTDEAGELVVTCHFNLPCKIDSLFRNVLTKELEDTNFEVVENYLGTTSLVTFCFFQEHHNQLQFGTVGRRGVKGLDGSVRAFSSAMPPKPATVPAAGFAHPFGGPMPPRPHGGTAGGPQAAPFGSPTPNHGAFATPPATNHFAGQVDAMRQQMEREAAARIAQAQEEARKTRAECEALLRQAKERSHMDAQAKAQLEREATAKFAQMRNEVAAREFRANSRMAVLEEQLRTARNLEAMAAANLGLRSPSGSIPDAAVSSSQSSSQESVATHTIEMEMVGLTGSVRPRNDEDAPRRDDVIRSRVGDLGAGGSGTGGLSGSVVSTDGRTEHA